MQLIKQKIEGKQIDVFTESKKFALANKKGEVKSLLEENGAIVKKFNKDEDIYLLIGQDFMASGNYFYRNRKYLFEGELVENQSGPLSFFPNLKADFYDMMRELLQRKDLYVHYFSIGKPLTDEDFEKYEKKLKKKIPLAVKEFYSLFGHIKILWDYSEPYVRRGIRAGKAWNLDAYDNHIGSIQMLPLHTVLFEKWNEQLTLDDSERVFDFYSDYNMIALSLDSTENPTMSKGDDYGVTFNDHSTLTFCDYIHLTLNMRGLKERGSYFVYYGSGNDPKIALEDMLKKAIAIPVLT